MSDPIATTIADQHAIRVEPAITRELAVPPVDAPPLDPDLFIPNAVEREFLLKAISANPEEMERRVRRIQVLYVSRCILISTFIIAGADDDLSRS